MTRNVRVGTTYHCQSAITPLQNINTPENCETGGVLLAFEPRNGSSSTNSDQVVYRLNGAQLERSTDGGDTFIAITAPEVNIQNFKFYVAGSATGDAKQPKVLFTISGVAGISPKSQTTFNLEAMVVQRLLDL